MLHICMYEMAKVIRSTSEDTAVPCIKNSTSSLGGFGVRARVMTDGGMP
jgi:hypothetical protein